ncbi:protein yippee-like isoform X4 [Elaeis guineensis]|nr:protein yippee-like isoform X4 [Elaeis guineensis]XP_029117589.1 protein yippee-like isoform X4 [Elaeis guineensis]
MGRLISSVRCCSLQMITGAYRWDLGLQMCQDEMVTNRVNVTVGLKEERMMMTGLHTVSDIFCVGCGSIVGWKYEAAHEKSQKYKEGKFILERFKVSGPDGSHYWVSHDPHVGGSDADDA